MYPSEEDATENEVCEITFKHYVEIITVVFNTSTQVGEVFLHVVSFDEMREDVNWQWGLPVRCHHHSREDPEGCGQRVLTKLKLQSVRV